MIDALARPTATLRSKLLRRIPAPQTTSGFAEAAPGGRLKNLLLPLTFGGGNAKLSAFFPFGRAMP